MRLLNVILLINIFNNQSMLLQDNQRTPAGAECSMRKDTSIFS